MNKILTKDYLERLEIALKYINKNENRCWEIEQIMPTYIKNLILKGEKFQIKYQGGVGYIITWDKRTNKVLSKYDLETESKTIYASMSYCSDGILDAVTIVFHKDDREWHITMDYMDKECNRLVSPFTMSYKDKENKTNRSVIFDGGNELHINYGKCGRLSEMSEEDAQAFKKYGAVNAPELPF